MQMLFIVFLSMGQVATVRIQLHIRTHIRYSFLKRKSVHERITLCAGNFSPVNLVKVIEPIVQLNGDRRVCVRSV